MRRPRASQRGTPRPRAQSPPTPYEPPRLTVLGTFHDLTRQQLKVEPGADFEGFQPSF